ncbi:MAG: TRAP transporter small permease [Oceanobacillus sp.]|nr:TRAP transporter small permease [Oceanobacillus sp.]
MKKLLNQTDKILTKVEENLIFILLFSMLMAVFSSFISRYFFDAQLRWSEELSRYLMIWATFIAVSYGVKKGAHITLDVLVVYFNEKANKVLRAISYIVSSIYCLIVIFAGIPFVNNLMQTGQTSPAMQIPMYTVYFSIVVGSILMLIRYIILFVNDIFYGKTIENTNNLDQKVS